MASRRRDGRFFWPLSIGLGYTVLTLGALAIEYVSELSKFSRGSFTDTLSPLFYTDLLTFPLSLVRSDWPGYPTAFDEAQYRDVLREAVASTVMTTVLQAAFLTAAVWAVIELRRTQPVS